MNKGKMAIIIAILLVIGIACTYFFVLRGNDDNSQSGDKTEINTKLMDQDNWLTIDTIPKLEALAKKNNVEIELDVEDAYVGGLPFADGEASYNYKFDENNKIIGLSIGHILVGSTESGDNYTMEQIDSKELSKRIRVVFDWISEFLNVKIGDKFYIIAEEGDILAVDDMSSYQRILDGSAYLELRILDKDNSVWSLEIESVGGYNMVTCVFEHYPSGSDEAKIPCNVAIE